MKEEYVIINKTQHVDRLKKLMEEKDTEHDTQKRIYLKGKITMLEAVFLQSIDLIPEIEKAFDAGEALGRINCIGIPKKDYISNLKLDI